MSLGKFCPNTRELPQETKDFYWRNHGFVAISIDDPKLPWDLKEMLSRFMTREHGTRKIAGQILRR
jgi:hypothetical protein